jgi:hypothetical protein
MKPPFELNRCRRGGHAAAATKGVAASAGTSLRTFALCGAEARWFQGRGTLRRRSATVSGTRGAFRSESEGTASL